MNISKEMFDFQFIQFVTIFLIDFDHIEEVNFHIRVGIYSKC
jgi:hypothetical protein